MHARSAPRPRAREARVWLWDWIEEHYPAAWDEPDSPLLHDPDVIQQASEYLRSRRFLASPGLLEKWLGDAHRYSPFVDEVAVERAVRLDYEAYLGLTDVERTEAIDRLAELPMFTGKENSKKAHDPHRARAWEELPDEVRKNLATIVSKRRQRRKGINP